MRFVFWTAVILFVLCFQTAVAELHSYVIHPPGIEAGDRWIFVDHRNGSEIILRAISRHADFYVFEEEMRLEKKEMRYDFELNQIDGDKKLDFPLYVGKKWSWKKRHSWTTSVVADFEVLSRETRKVPAGSFDTLKIRAVMKPRVFGIRAPWTGIVDYWYSKRAGNIIEVAPDFENDEIFPRALKSFEYKNATAGCCNR